MAEGTNSDGGDSPSYFKALAICPEWWAYRYSAHVVALGTQQLLVTVMCKSIINFWRMENVCVSHP